MRQIALMLITTIAILSADTTATYFWPIPGGDKKVNSNLGDYRPQSSYGPAHFHTGIDIPAVTEDVWSITLSFRVDSIKKSSIGYRVKIHHYSDDTTVQLSHGSWYIHMNAVDTLNIREGVIYIGNVISHQTTFWNDHLHLDYRRPHALSGSRAINPFILDTLRVEDTFRPILNNLYVDYSCHGNATVENLNFLKYDFSHLFKDTTYQQITFKKLKMPTETPYNDLDDPHILISGNRRVRFVLEGHDNFFAETDRGAPYILATFLDYCLTKNNLWI